jgi:hypothetical protein
MTREEMVADLINAQWEMMSERDLRAMFVNWMSEEYREISDEELRAEHAELFDSVAR